LKHTKKLYLKFVCIQKAINSTKCSTVIGKMGLLGQILLKAMCLLAFHAFLRVGEIIVWLKNKQYYCFQLS
jgi:hypothetical protein